MKRGLILVVLVLVISMPISLAAETRNIHVDNNIIATVKDGDEIQYIHEDRIGSLRFTSDEESETSETYRNFPFGESVISPRGRYSFTGKELDQSELHYFNARYYDSDKGRFISTDSIKTNHPYSYVMNNPLTFIDPDGKRIVSVPHKSRGWLVEDILNKNIQFYDINSLIGDTIIPKKLSESDKTYLVEFQNMKMNNVNFDTVRGLTGFNLFGIRGKLPTNKHAMYTWVIPDIKFFAKRPGITTGSSPTLSFVYRNAATDKNGLGLYLRGMSTLYLITNEGINRNLDKAGNTGRYFYENVASAILALHEFEALQRKGYYSSSQDEIRAAIKIRRGLLDYIEEISRQSYKHEQLSWYYKLEALGKDEEKALLVLFELLDKETSALYSDSVRSSVQERLDKLHYFNEYKDMLDLIVDQTD